VSEYYLDENSLPIKKVNKHLGSPFSSFEYLEAGQIWYDPKSSLLWLIHKVGEDLMKVEICLADESNTRIFYVPKDFIETPYFIGKL